MLAEQGQALTWLGPPPGGPLARAVRRGADLLGATVGLVLGAPLMAAAALGVRLTMGSPVLFRQQRAGRYGRPFTVLKFRTMREANDAAGRPRPDEERMTSLGRLLRRFSIDELPQLWNVVRGEMSLVGPRPLLLEYLPVYTAQEQKRHLVRPGLTGYAQVRGRHTLRFSERLTLDSWYVEHWSPWLDAKILLATIPTALSSKHSVVVQEEELDDRGFAQHMEALRAGRRQDT
jgi:sugar transferase EpsL